MSKFAARMAVGLSAIYDSMGDAATYTDRYGATASCVVILDLNLQQYDEPVNLKAGSGVIRVRRSEISARPVREETFEITGSGETYRVEQLIESDEFEHWCLVA